MGSKEFDQGLIDVHVAHFLNDMIGGGFVDCGKISKSADIEFGELIIRYGDEIQKWGSVNSDGEKYEVPQARLEKIGTLLGYEKAQDRDVICATIEIVKLVLDVLVQETRLPFTGVIVFGSRMDPEKNPRNCSDLDICLVTDSIQNFTCDFETVLGWEELIKSMGLPYEVSINGLLSNGSVYNSVNDSARNQAYVPAWAWNPDGFAFVGEFVVGGYAMRDGVATEFLRQLADSEEMNQRRIMKIRQAEIEIGRAIAREE